MKLQNEGNGTETCVQSAGFKDEHSMLVHYSRVLSIQHQVFFLFSQFAEKRVMKKPLFYLMFSVCRGNIEHFYCLSTGFAVATEFGKARYKGREFPVKCSFSASITR